MLIPDINDFKETEGDAIGSFDVGTPLIVPMEDPETVNDLMAIDRKTKEDIRLCYKLALTNDWECNTIATVTLETLIGVLYSNIIKNGVTILNDTDMEAGTLNFYDIIVMTSSYKENKSADKTGNINIVFSPGSIVNELSIEDGSGDDIVYMEPKARFGFPENQAKGEAFGKIDALARRQLKEQYNVVMSTQFGAIGVTYTMLKNLYQYLVIKLARSERKSAMINFNDIIEVYAENEGGEIAEIYIRPGMGAKLIIKSDISTEEDDED